MIAFKVVTPKGEYLKQEVKSIHVKTVVGETTILPNHMPIFASLVPCKLVLKNENDEEEIFAISGFASFPLARLNPVETSTSDFTRAHIPLNISSTMLQVVDLPVPPFPKKIPPYLKPVLRLGMSDK